MSDDERIARCTELARRVWPYSDVSAYAEEDGSAYVNDEPDAPPFIEIAHPRALDALEAALLALAAGGQITPQVRAAYDALVGNPPAEVRELQARIAELEAQLAQSPCAKLLERETRAAALDPVVPGSDKGVPDQAHSIERIAVLEARLAKVRAWLDDEDEIHELRDLRVILGGV